MTDDNVIPIAGAGKPSVEELVAHLIEQHGGRAVLEELGFQIAPGFDGPGFGFGGPAFGASFGRPTPKLLPRRRKRAGYVIRVDLDDVKPPIWRRLRVASDLTLARVHEVLQASMGWMDVHLHDFQMGPDAKDNRMMPFLTDADVAEGDTVGIHERDVRLDQVLADPGQRLFYTYDFGDSWHHTIKLEKVEPWVPDAPDAACLAGRRACPPEDCGGIPGYRDILEALRGDGDADLSATEPLLEWLPPDFDPDHFDAEEINAVLADSVNLDEWHPALRDLLGRGGPLSPVGALIGEATNERGELTADELDAALHRYRYLIAAVGDGVKLTQAGNLPAAWVQRIYSDLNLAPDPSWRRVPTREDQAPSVRGLRESATALGLLRKQKGVLSVTAAGRRLVDTPEALFRHIRDRLPLGRAQAEKDAGVLALLYTASGEDFYDVREAAGQVFAFLGWRSEEPMATAVWWDAEPTRDVIEHLTSAPSEGVDLPAKVARALLGR